MMEMMMMRNDDKKFSQHYTQSLCYQNTKKSPELDQLTTN